MSKGCPLVFTFSNEVWSFERSQNQTRYNYHFLEQVRTSEAHLCHTWNPSLAMIPQRQDHYRAAVPNLGCTHPHGVLGNTFLVYFCDGRKRLQQWGDRKWIPFGPRPNSTAFSDAHSIVLTACTLISSRWRVCLLQSGGSSIEQAWVLSHAKIHLIHLSWGSHWSSFH